MPKTNVRKHPRQNKSGRTNVKRHERRIDGAKPKTMRERLDEHLARENLDVQGKYREALLDLIRNDEYSFDDIISVSDLEYGQQIEFTDGEFIFATDSEADELFFEDQRNMWDDMGIDSYSEWFRDSILNNTHGDFVNEDWFEMAERESHESRWDDEDNEYVREEHATRFDSHKSTALSVDDMRVALVDDDMSGDSIQEYRSQVGESDFRQVVADNNLIDKEAVFKEALRENNNAGERRGTLSSYDGSEREFGDIYVFRTN